MFIIAGSRRRLNKISLSEIKIPIDQIEKYLHHSHITGKVMHSNR